MNKGKLFQHSVSFALFDAFIVGVDNDQGGIPAVVRTSWVGLVGNC